jgi:hypothetical protein
VPDDTLSVEEYELEPDDALDLEDDEYNDSSDYDEHELDDDLEPIDEFEPGDDLEHCDNSDPQDDADDTEPIGNPEPDDSAADTAVIAGAILIPAIGVAGFTKRRHRRATNSYKLISSKRKK